MNSRIQIDAKTTQIPDLWHLAMALRDWGMEPASAAVLETWHLAHDLRKALAAAQDADASGWVRSLSTGELSRVDELVGDNPS